MNLTITQGLKHVARPTATSVRASDVFNSVVSRLAQYVHSNTTKTVSADSVITSTSNGHLQTQMQARALSHDIDTKALFTHGQTIALDITTSTLGAISLFGSLMTFYWFFRMRTRFRHKLIMILVIGDLIRSIWFFIIPLINLVRGPVESHTDFCQVSGFFLQVGIETADYAILVIAIHTFLQVFRPTIGGYDGRSETGLYRWRYAIYAGAAVIPSFMCSLAFIRKNGAYLSQGPTCSLPLRPFWYRLAIAWIPRYMILATVAGLYLAIYIHSQDPSSRWKRLFSKAEGPKLWVTVVCDNRQNGQADGAVKMDFYKKPASSARQDSIVDPLSPGSRGPLPMAIEDRKLSMGTTLAASSSGDRSSWTREIPLFSRRGTIRSSVTGLDGCFDFVRKAQSQISENLDSAKTSDQASAHSKEKNTVPEIIGRKIITQQMQAKNNAIQYQLRLLLAYPAAYFAFWFFPFVFHLCSYSNYLAQHPVFPLAIIAYGSQASMGALNGLMFSVRERPWRHIKGSDGTFLGSFLFWRHNGNRRSSDGTDDTQARKPSMWSGYPNSSVVSASASSPIRRSTLVEHTPYRERHGSTFASRPGLPGRNNSYNSYAPSFEERPGRERLGSNFALRPGLPGRNNSYSSYMAPSFEERHGIDEIMATPPAHSHWADQHEYFPSYSTRLQSIYSVGSDDEMDKELAMIDRRLDEAIMRQQFRK